MTNLADVHRMYRKTLYIENTHIIDVSLATYIGKDAGTEPIWLNPIAPSGFGKTTAILPLIDLSFDWKDPNNKDNLMKRKYDIYFVDDITSATFGSGSAAKKKESDLGHWLEDRNTLLIISDLSPILTMDGDSKNKLFGKFRTLYDGYVKVDTGASNKYFKDIHMNMIAFSTAEARRHLDLHTSLGTREISYEVPKVNHVEKALLSKETKDSREDRSTVVKNFIDDLQVDWKEAEEKLDKERQIVSNLATRLTYWRASPVADDDGYLTQHVEPEYPMRVKNQLESIYKSFHVLGIKNPLTRVLEIVNSCGNPVRREILSKMYVVEDDIYRPRERNVNAFFMSQLLHISPTTILTNFFVLWEMNLICPLLDEEEKYRKPIDCSTYWIPIVKHDMI